jgi:hypothetical protein
MNDGLVHYAEWDGLVHFPDEGLTHGPGRFEAQPPGEVQIPGAGHVDVAPSGHVEIPIPPASQTDFVIENGSGSILNVFT